MEELNEMLQMKRHSMAHVLAKALKQIYGDALKLTIGPAIDNGFYYDIDMEKSIVPEDFKQIEKKMDEILRKNEDFTRKVVSKEEALEVFKDNQYKVELISELPENEEITLYYLGDDFVDLCRGPHVENTKFLRSFAFKLNKVAGAYWRGDVKNKMLQRVYVYGFEDKQTLKDYLNMLEEAKKRDHRKIGKEMELFFFDETAPGMAYWLPNGFTMMNILIDDWRKLHRACGYQEFSAPQVNNSILWRTSGHWDHYKEDMYVLKDADGTEQALKPMSCPNSIKVYQFKMRSYKDLPLRFNDVDVIHRNEKSGQLNGLFRVRMFRQDDSHNFVTEDQIKSEVKEIVAIASKLYGDFGLPYVLTLSTRPQDYMGDISLWNKAESELKEVLNELCGEDNYRINEGDGAFYGPKIDIKMKDCLGREWQMGTIQLDFQLPLRFELEYTDEHGDKKRPIMIHRALYGSFERFIGILTEHFAGAFPAWIAPMQVRILAISDKFNDYANKVKETLEKEGFRVEFDDRSETIGKKIREAQLMKLPYTLIVGENEVNAGTVSVRKRKEGDIGAMTVEEFAAKLRSDVENKSIN